MQLRIARYAYLGVYLVAAMVAALVLGASQSLLAHADTSVPTSTNVVATPTDTGATITWNTDVPGTSQVAFGTSTSYGSTTPLDNTLVTSHSVTLSGLTPATTYHFIVMSMGATSTASSSNDMTFLTSNTGSSTATTTASTTQSGPAISGILASPTDTGATITWTTDVPATDQVMYGTSSGNYSASTTLGSTLGTTHTATLSGLNPNTTYFFVVQSMNASSTASTSPEMTFTTASSTNNGGTGSTTPTGPSISGITATPTDTTAMINWNTDVPASTQVLFGTTSGNHPNASTLDTGLVTSHTATLTGLTPNTTYFFVVQSMNASSTASTSPEMTFTTSMSTTTGTTTSDVQDQLNELQNQINDLQDQINVLKAQIAGLLGGTGTTSTTTPPVTSSASIDQNNQTVTAGTGIDFGGRGFGKEEHVKVMLNGSQVGTAFTNSAGSFSTGSMSVPNTPNTTLTYTFVGQNSGITATATIHLQ